MSQHQTLAPHCMACHSAVAFMAANPFPSSASAVLRESLGPSDSLLFGPWPMTHNLDGFWVVCRYCICLGSGLLLFRARAFFRACFRHISGCLANLVYVQDMNCPSMLSKNIIRSTGVKMYARESSMLQTFTITTTHLTTHFHNKLLHN